MKLDKILVQRAFRTFLADWDLLALSKELKSKVGRQMLNAEDELSQVHSECRLRDMTTEECWVTITCHTSEAILTF